MYDLNPRTWYGDRVLENIPIHFIKASTPVTTESIQWVRNKLSGRFATTLESHLVIGIFETHAYIYFEEPGDVLMYELRWSGSK